ncbi:MAG TPA: class I SAM-dependent methyltransferase [Roseomonas sp.]|jgi:SAM-dependent methyltransferase
MSVAPQNFAAGHYAPRAQDYVTSAVHSSGADLDQVEAEIRDMAGARVLDLGCGGGHVSYRAAPHVAEVMACDVTEAMLQAVAATAAERGLGNIVTRQAAAEALPFADAAFDAVLCRFTTHHWQDMEGGLREARRVAKRGARAVFIDSIAPPDRAQDSHLQAVELLRDASHGRNYSLAEWVAALSRAGFAVEGVTIRVLRMEFPTWIARTRTPAAHAAAIRSLQDGAAEAVRTHFAIGADGSFDLQAATILARAA